MIHTPKPAHFSETGAEPPTYTPLPTPLSPPLPSVTSTRTTAPTTATPVTSFPINASMNMGLERTQVKENFRLTAEEKPVGVIIHIGQTLLVLLTSPFVLLYGILKLMGTIFKGIGMLFIMLGDLAYTLAYKPGKTLSRVISNETQLV